MGGQLPASAVLLRRQSPGAGVVFFEESELLSAHGHLMQQLNAPTVFMPLWSLHCDMFRHSSAIFREYILSLELFAVKWITPMKFITFRSKCNVYTVCRQTQLSTRWYADLLNVNLNYMFRPQSLAIIRLYKRKLIN